MVDFNSELPKGRPTLDPNYWNQFNNKDDQKITTIFDLNENAALKKLSIFGNEDNK